LKKATSFEKKENRQKEEVAFSMKQVSTCMRLVCLILAVVHCECFPAALFAVGLGCHRKAFSISIIRAASLQEGLQLQQRQACKSKAGSSSERRNAGGAMMDDGAGTRAEDEGLVFAMRSVCTRDESRIFLREEALVPAQRYKGRRDRDEMAIASSSIAQRYENILAHSSLVPSFQVLQQEVCDGEPRKSSTQEGDSQQLPVQGHADQVQGGNVDAAFVTSLKQEVCGV